MLYFNHSQGQAASPSTRREWIEMLLPCHSLPSIVRLPPHGGSGLKCILLQMVEGVEQSPSTRREWIEIGGAARHHPGGQSPSTRREWIEITFAAQNWRCCQKSPSTRREWIEIGNGVLTHLIHPSPSTRREWIEIFYPLPPQMSQQGLPPHGGSGLKFCRLRKRSGGTCLPPHGGSGLKYYVGYS